MQHLLPTTITDSGICHGIEFPLHPETTSAEAVSDFAANLLETISKVVKELDNFKHEISRKHYPWLQQSEAEWLILHR